MWGRWARTSGINEKFISFILKNPQMVTAKDNPRAWSNGFLELKGCSYQEHIELVMSGVVDGYLLLRKLDGDKSVVADSGNFIEKDKIDNLLNNYQLNSIYLDMYVKSFYGFIEIINDWLEQTGNEFIIDNKTFIIRNKS